MPKIFVCGLVDLGLFNGHENPFVRHGNACQREVIHKIPFQVYNFASFSMQGVSLFWVCFVLHAIEFFEGSIGCLYSFFLRISRGIWWWCLFCVKIICIQIISPTFHVWDLQSRYACKMGSFRTGSEHSEVYTNFSHNFSRNSMVHSVYDFQKRVKRSL